MEPTISLDLKNVSVILSDVKMLKLMLNQQKMVGESRLIFNSFRDIICLARESILTRWSLIISFFFMNLVFSQLRELLSCSLFIDILIQFFFFT